MIDIFTSNKGRKDELPGILTLILLSLIILTVITAFSASKVNWVKQSKLSEELDKNKSKIVMIYFYSESCGPCRKMEMSNFHNSAVVQNINRNYIPLKINVGKVKNFMFIENRYNVKEFLKENKIEGIPAIVFYSDQITGKNQFFFKIVGYRNSFQFIKLLKDVKKEYYRRLKMFRKSSKKKKKNK